MATNGSVPARPALTVSAFLENGRDRLRLDLAAGAPSLKRTIGEAVLNRPGLALSGFYRSFAHRRIQVIGLAEHEYLRSLGAARRARRLRDFFRRRVPCVVVARQRAVFPEMAALAAEFGVPVLRTRMVTKDFVNAATILLENLAAVRIKVQGTMVEFMGIGVLIEGKPGMGKSETALALIRRGGALVSDDVTELHRDSAGSVIGAPISLTRYHMDVRGIGIVHVPSLFGISAVREEKRLDLIVSLAPAAEEDERSGRPQVTDVLGVPVPRVDVRVVPGRDLANIVETAALDQKLKRLGHDAAKELDERMIASMRGRAAGSD